MIYEAGRCDRSRVCDRERVGVGVGFFIKDTYMNNIMEDKFILDPNCVFTCPSCGSNLYKHFMYPNSFRSLAERTAEQYCALCHIVMDLSYFKCTLRTQDELEKDNAERHHC